jgi:hypothetical protein
MAMWVFDSFRYEHSKEPIGSTTDEYQIIKEREAYSNTLCADLCDPRSVSQRPDQVDRNGQQTDDKQLRGHPSF